jgi:hypothetical protein
MFLAKSAIDNDLNLLMTMSIEDIDHPGCVKSDFGHGKFTL